MAVQRFLGCIQGRETQIAACGGRRTHFRVDAVDKALPGILTGKLKLRFQFVDFGDRRRHYNAHSSLDLNRIGRDLGTHRRHHRSCSGSNVRRFGLDDLHKRRDHGLHRRVRDGCILRDRGTDCVQHTDNSRCNLAVAVVERSGEPCNTSAGQRTQGTAEIGKRILVNVLDALCQIDKAPDGCDNPIHLRQVNRRNRGIVVAHGISKFSDVIAKSGKGLITAKPLVEKTAIGKTSRQVG